MSTNLLNELGIYVFVNSLLCQCYLLSIRNLTIRSSRNKPFTILSQSLDFWASPNFCFYFFNGFIAEEYSSTSYTIYIYMYVYMCSTVTQKKIFELFEIQTISTPHTDSHMYFTTTKLVTRSLHFVEGAYLLSVTTNVNLPMIMLTFPTMNLK